MPDVKYTDNEGLMWIVGVPPNAPEEIYKWGVPVGPPDLSSLGLTKTDRKKLQNALVDAGFVLAPHLVGKRKELKALLKKLELPDSLLREIISLYQRVYYTD